ncbi:PR-1protein [Moniliophthora roreri]|nr:PR-1protein [Moniliophthora roreri]
MLCALTCVKWLVEAGKRGWPSRARNTNLTHGGPWNNTLTRFAHPTCHRIFNPIQDRTSSSQVLSIATLCIIYTTEKLAEVLLAKAKENFTCARTCSYTPTPLCLGKARRSMSKASRRNALD